MIHKYVPWAGCIILLCLCVGIQSTSLPLLKWYDAPLYDKQGDMFASRSNKSGPIESLYDSVKDNLVVIIVLIVLSALLLICLILSCLGCCVVLSMICLPYAVCSVVVLTIALGLVIFFVFFA